VLARSSDGIVAVDAMIALMILSTTVALSLQVVDTARRVAVRASEMRYAEAALRGYADAGITSIGFQTGTGDRFTWKVSLTPNGGDTVALRTCTKVVDLRALASGRAYRVATTVPCPRDGSNP
jgi:hypothetical protein